MAKGSLLLVPLPFCPGKEAGGKAGGLPASLACWPQLLLHLKGSWWLKGVRKESLP